MEANNNAVMRDTHGATGEGWYGFDLDGTLAKYDGWKGIDHIGEPVKPMVDLIRRMHDEGKVVKIMTARVSPRPNPETAKTRYPLYVGEDVGDIPMYAARWKEEMQNAGRLADWIDACDFYTKEMWTARDFIADWCLENLGFLPEIVYQKDHLMLDLYDDRVKQVVPNAGILVENLAGCGNAAAMREAVGNALWCLRWMDENTSNESIKDHLAKPIELLTAALNAPPRNCDRFGSESEMRAAFIAWYNEAYDLKGSKDEIDHCDLKHDVDGILHDYIEWLCSTAEPETKGETDGSK